MHRYKKYKSILMLMALMLLFGVSAQATMAYLTVKTEPVKNTFVPVQSPQHDLEIKVTGEKSVIDSETEESAWKEGDSFNFEVQIWEGNKWETVGTAAVAYDKDDEDFYRFDVSEIIKEQITGPKDYSFRIAETKGADKTITYDETAGRFDVKVTEDSTGAMDITSVTNIEGTEVSKDTAGNYTAKVDFTNIYTKPYIPPEPEDPDPIDILIHIEKIVKNTGKGEIGPEGFSFKLVRDSDKEEYTAVSDTEGDAVIGLTYTKEDVGSTYIYELSEIDEGKKDITYSDKVYEVVIKVELNQENEIITSMKVDDKVVKDIEAKFENIYDGKQTPTIPTKPSGPDKDDGSKTGDDSNMIPVIAIMIGCLAVMAAVIFGGRRRRSS